MSFEKEPATAETRVHSVGEVKHWLAKGFLPEQSFLNSNIFYGVGVKEAVVDSLNVIYSILLIEHVE